MPKSGKGKAFEKPNDNYEHKSAMHKVAQSLADKAGSKREGLALECCKFIEDSTLPPERKPAAKQAVDVACAQLAQGRHPFEGLRPPSSCGPCKGSHGTHHFLCQKRVQLPAQPEKAVRTAVTVKLQAAWRARQYELQQVRIRPH